MSSWHRVSRLLLRRGIVYSGGKAWTGVHDRWLRAQRFASQTLALTHETTQKTMLAAVDRRDRFDAVLTVMAGRTSAGRAGQPMTAHSLAS